MIPILHFPGEIIPGQLGPIRRVFEFFSAAATRTISSVGMPSVMQMTSGNPASAASKIASAAKGGGTKITEAFAPVAFTASATVLKTGTSRCLVPPLPGVTPPTTLRAVIEHLLRVKTAFAAGEALHQHPRVLVRPERSSRTSGQASQLSRRRLSCHRRQ